MILLFALFVTISFGQNCKVKTETLNVKYEGNCKKGYAHGQGKAWGIENFYEGNFKKGLPHGKGVYKWKNGNIYIGDFKKGKLHGKGKLVIKHLSKKSETQEGFFKNNNFLGKYKKPYKVVSKSGVRRVSFYKNNIGNINNDVKILIYANGAIIYPELRITDANNTQVENRNGIVLSEVVFPLKKVQISFRVGSFSYRTTFEIYEKGSWKVEVSI